MSNPNNTGILAGSKNILKKKTAKPTTANAAPTTATNNAANPAGATPVAPNPAPTAPLTTAQIQAIAQNLVAKAAAKPGEEKKDEGPNLLKMLHAILDCCNEGESIVITKFKKDKEIKLRFGYNIATQTSQFVTKAPGLKEACVSTLNTLIAAEKAKSGKKKP